MVTFQEMPPQDAEDAWISPVIKIILSKIKRLEMSAQQVYVIMMLLPVATPLMKISKGGDYGLWRALQ